MTDFTVRVAEDGELRQTADVFRGAMHLEPISDERWKYVRPLFEPDRAFAAFADGRMVGTAMSFPSSLVLPGGATLPMAGVTYVGVRSDHTRRGVLTGLMRAQLTAAAEAGDVFAGLHASEGGIYGRFGYGVASISRTVTVECRRAVFRPEVPRRGEVRLLDPDEALDRLPKIYERMLGSRPGMIGRPAGWWSMAYERRLRASDDHLLVAVHTGPDDEDGFVGYRPQRANPNDMSSDAMLVVLDMVGANPAAIADMWRYLLSVDLVGKVSAYVRPLDEPVEAMLVNQHAVHAELDDDLWLRILDVSAALAGRTYGDAPPVVLEIRDRLLPNNSGRYRISPHGTERTTDPADLSMDADVLAAIYLGASRPSILAGVGRVEVAQPAALAHTDRLFATDAPTWCGTMF